MNEFCLLLDESLPRWVQTAVWRRCPHVSILRGGASGGPAIGSTDPEVLRFAESRQALLVTADRRTMPQHDHIHSGGITWGVVIVRRSAVPRDVINDLILILEASTPDEWRNVLTYVPFA